jgi:hypothetical protein
MKTPTQNEPMRRKPILMPPAMIEKVDRIAAANKVSFAAVVRGAVDAFDGDLSKEDETLLEALAETMTQTTRKVVKKIDSTGKRLDETHEMLEAR